MAAGAGAPRDAARAGRPPRRARPHRPRAGGGSGRRAARRRHRLHRLQRALLPEPRRLVPGARRRHGGERHVVRRVARRGRVRVRGRSAARTPRPALAGAPTALLVDAARAPALLPRGAPRHPARFGRHARALPRREGLFAGVRRRSPDAVRLGRLVEPGGEHARLPGRRLHPLLRQPRAPAGERPARVANGPGGQPSIRRGGRAGVGRPCGRLPGSGDRRRDGRASAGRRRLPARGDPHRIRRGAARARRARRRRARGRRAHAPGRSRRARRPRRRDARPARRPGRARARAPRPVRLRGERRGAAHRHGLPADAPARLVQLEPRRAGGGEGGRRRVDQLLDEPAAAAADDDRLHRDAEPRPDARRREGRARRALRPPGVHAGHARRPAAAPRPAGQTSNLVLRELVRGGLPRGRGAVGARRGRGARRARAAVDGREPVGAHRARAAGHRSGVPASGAEASGAPAVGGAAGAAPAAA